MLRLDQGLHCEVALMTESNDTTALRPVPWHDTGIYILYCIMTLGAVWAFRSVLTVAIQKALK